MLQLHTNNTYFFIYVTLKINIKLFKFINLCVYTEAPCLSFDVVTDDHGDGREEFPLTCCLVGGTQASRAQANSVIVMKLTNLCRTQKSKDDDDEEDDRLLMQVLHNCRAGAVFKPKPKPRFFQKTAENRNRDFPLHT